MKTLSICLAAGLAAAGLSADVTAQGAPAWNRRAEAISVLPPVGATGGDATVSAVFSVGLNAPTSVPLDLSTDVVFLLNGIEVGRNTVPVLVDAGSGGCAACGGSCGTGAVNGLAATLFCLEESAQTGCSCQFLPITSTIPIPAAPGDEIMVLLMPSPGALPDSDGSDDLTLETYNGGKLFWDRRISSAHVEPSPGAPAGVYDLKVDWYIVTAGSATHRVISPQFLVKVNGVELGPYETPCGPWIAQPNGMCDSCDGSTCGVITCNGEVQYVTKCLQDPDGEGCACVADITYPMVIPGLVLEPDDEIVVILKPAPGALPELPGFPDDEEPVDPPYDPWQDLGFALGGTHGDPEQLGTGTLVAGDAINLTLVNALENTTAHLVIAFNTVFAPFKGGVMVPDAANGYVLPFPTGGAGVVNLAGSWPEGVPADFATYFQWWIEDIGGPNGFAASNALSATTPP